MDFVKRSQTTLAGATAGSHASSDEDALQRCRLSHARLRVGDYEQAAEAMGGLWRGACERPAVGGLGAAAAAAVMVQAGRLTSALGGARRIEGAQEAAKNLLSEAAGLFERLGDAKRVAEARSEMGLCYWREGAYEEARVVLHSALDALSQQDCEQKALALIRLSVVEVSARRYEAAARLLEEAAPYVEASGGDDLLKGCFHTERAITFRALSTAAGGDAELLDRALVEYAAANYHLELAGHTRYHANNENNLAFLFNSIGRHEEAHEHLARARALVARLKDTVSLAQCDDTLARMLTAEGRFEEAARAAASAVRAFEDGDRQALLADALTTLGVAQARAGRHDEARRSLARALETAEAAGDRSGAAAAALAVAEELGAEMSPAEACAAFARAHDLLAGTRDPKTLERLAACARRAVESVAGLGEDQDDEEEHVSPEERWAGFSLKSEVLRHEGELIERALHDADGVVSRAAKLLGFRHHQTFVALLNNRHKQLLGARSPIIPRRRSIVRRGAAARRGD